MMLRYTEGKSRVPAGVLSPEDSDKIKRAFGCSPDPTCRAEARSLVKSHQEKGRWLLCDCQPHQERPPTLFLTIDGYIEREDKGDGTPHDEDCAFARDESKQFEIVITYRQRERSNRTFTLLRNSGEGHKKPISNDPVVIRRQSKRSGLATLLFELLDDAKLTRVMAGETLRGGKERRQLENELLKKSAESFFLAAGQPLSEWVATDIKELPALRAKIKAKNKKWKRPHGIFIDVFYRIEGKDLYLKNSDKPFATVTGSFKVFGEKEAKIRPPYLVIGLMAVPENDSTRVEIIRAYAHPCVAWDRMLPVDSDLERQTLNLILECRAWLSEKRNVTFTIEKPAFDKAPLTETGRRIIKPDFILRNRNKTGKHEAIIVETMGTDDPAYRESKLSLRPCFERLSKDEGESSNPVIEHDRFNKPNMTKDQIDQEFKKTIIKTILA